MIYQPLKIARVTLLLMLHQKCQVIRQANSTCYTGQWKANVLGFSSKKIVSWDCENMSLPTTFGCMHGGKTWGKTALV